MILIVAITIAGVLFVLAIILGVLSLFFDVGDVIISLFRRNRKDRD